MTNVTTGIFRPTILLIALAVLPGSVNSTYAAPAQRPGKVIIIRGAFTVFSLGMNELGEKLAKYGLDVDVIADISAGSATSKLIAEYQRRRHVGPIVFIGHSRGAELGPKQARTPQEYGIPVKLIVMVDGVHRTSIPSNVERCVNLYHNGTIGMPHGVPATADSKKTQLLNVDIDRLPSRSQGGSINHFNIDASPWIHDLVIAQVLKACPVEGPVVPPRTASSAAPKQTRATRSRTAPATPPRSTGKSTAQAVPTNSASNSASPVPGNSKSGLRFPASILGGKWPRSTDRTPVSAIDSPQNSHDGTPGRAAPEASTELAQPAPPDPSPADQSDGPRPRTARRPLTEPAPPHKGTASASTSAPNSMGSRADLGESPRTAGERKGPVTSSKPKKTKYSMIQTN